MLEELLPDDDNDGDDDDDDVDVDDFSRSYPNVFTRFSVFLYVKGTHQP